MKFQNILYCVHVIILGSTFVLVISTQPRPKPHEKLPFYKYILRWRSPNKSSRGYGHFLVQNCSKHICFLTSDKYYLNDITEYDVLIFYGPNLYIENNTKLIDMPSKRSRDQLYIFFSGESSIMFPVDEKLNNYFNYTWTYKLSSDIYYGYIIVRDKTGKTIGPKEDMNWMSIQDMLPINETVKMKLANKKFAAAWFVSNCESLSERGKLASQIETELAKHNMYIGIYGRCGRKQCPHTSMTKCLEMLQKDFYFYFAFENSFAEDYVSEKLLHALQNYAIPVVYGGANYSRFMPKGIYLNAYELTVKELVTQMVDIINNVNKYHDYFKWHNHYSYHGGDDFPDTNYYCQLCEYINDEKLKYETSIWRDLAAWYNT